MKAWFCSSCHRIFYRSPDHLCRLIPVMYPGVLAEGDKMPEVGVAHIASVRKWCES